MSLYGIADTEQRMSFFDELPLRRNVDAVIVASFNVTMEEISNLQGMGVPLIGVNVPHNEGFNATVSIDNAKSMRMAINHLHALGHRRIAYICTDASEAPMEYSADSRLQGFESACAAYEDIEQLTIALPRNDFTVDEAIARIERRSNEEPNGTTGVPPELLFMREKDALGPIGNRALLESMLGDVSHQTVPATMLVRCAGREFSVPRRMIGRRARLVLSADGSLRVYDGGDLVAVHDTRAPGGPVVYDPAHYAEALSGKRWCADGDIEEAARRNLELLGGLGGGGES